MYRIKVWHPDDREWQWLPDLKTGQAAEFQTADEAAPYLVSAREIYPEVQLTEMKQKGGAK